MEQASPQPQGELRGSPPRPCLPAGSVHELLAPPAGLRGPGGAAGAWQSPPRWGPRCGAEGAVTGGEDQEGSLRPWVDWGGLAAGRADTVGHSWGCTAPQWPQVRPPGAMVPCSQQGPEACVRAESGGPRTPCCAPKDCVGLGPGALPHSGSSDLSLLGTQGAGQSCQALPRTVDVEIKP